MKNITWRAALIVIHAQQAVQYEHELKMLFPGSQVCWQSQHKMTLVVELHRKYFAVASCHYCTHCTVANANY